MILAFLIGQMNGAVIVFCRAIKRLLRWTYKMYDIATGNILFALHISGGCLIY
jgi:hypothetical protein